MKIKLKYTLAIFFFFFFGSIIYAQTLKSNNAIIFTNLSDNLTGRYNIGLEYFFPLNKLKSENTKISLALNGGPVSINQFQKSIIGHSFTFETNLYTDFMLPKNWNEFGGIKVGYGSLKNKTDNNIYQNYFIGISTGIQPVIAKIITIKANGDIGYIHNGLTNTLLFDNRNELLYSGFTVNFNLGIGIRF
jgi:hypothetical protein